MENKSAIFYLFFANIVSGIAQGISLLAIPWYFADVLGKSSVFALSFGVITAISLFWQLYAGTLIDRYPRKNLFMVGSFLVGMVVLGAGIYGEYNANHLPMALVIGVFATTQLFFNIHYPTLYAFGQEITSTRNYSKINSWIEIQGQSTRIIAGAIGAVLLSGTGTDELTVLGLKMHLPFEIEPWSLNEIFLMDGASYILAVLIIARIRYRPMVEKQVNRDGLWSRLIEGFQFLRKNPLIFRFGVMSHMLFAFVLVQIVVLLPVYVDKFLESGADVFASGQAWYAIGALSSGVFIRKVFHRFKTSQTVMILMFIGGITAIYLSMGKIPALFFISTFLIGVTNAGTRITRVTFLFNQVPNHVIGRTNSVFSVINTAVRGVFIAIFSIPYFTENPTVSMGYAIGGIVILFSLIPLWNKRKRLFEISGEL